jgi:hypothetical protein
MSNNAVTVALCLALHPIIVLTEGTVISTRNFRNLVCTYAVTLAVHCTVLKTFAKQSFGAVWQSLLIFQFVRMLNYIVWGVVPLSSVEGIMSYFSTNTKRR